MGWSGGGSLLAQNLLELQEALGEYYGALNELKHGLEATVPEKPEALILYDQIKEFGVPLVSGGVLEQPWIFMQEYKIVDNIVKQMQLIEAVNAAAQRKAGPGAGEDSWP